MDRDPRRSREPLCEAGEEGAAAGEVEPPVQKIVGEIGRRRRDAERRRGKDPLDSRRDRVGHFGPGDHDRAHDPGRDVASADLDNFAELFRATPPDQ